MTIVVGLIDQDRRVFMGADTVRSNGNRYVDQNSKLTRMLVKRPYRTKSQEIAKKDAYIVVGTSGSIRAGQVVSVMPAPDWTAGQSAYHYLIGPFVAAVRSALEDAGQVGKSPIQSDETELTMLVAIDGCLFVIWQDFSVTQPIDPYAAIGSGTDLALGALFALHNFPPTFGLPGHPSAIDMVTKALHAAAAYDDGCGAPFDITNENGSVCRIAG